MISSGIGLSEGGGAVDPASAKLRDLWPDWLKKVLISGV